MSETKPRFRNRLYRAQLSRTDAGRPVVTIVPINPKGPLASYRQLSGEKGVTEKKGSGPSCSIYGLRGLLTVRPVSVVWSRKASSVPAK